MHTVGSRRFWTKGSDDTAAEEAERLAVESSLGVEVRELVIWKQ